MWFLMEAWQKACKIQDEAFWEDDLEGFKVASDEIHRLEDAMRARPAGR